MSFTIVSALVDIGRGKWTNHWYNRSIETYLCYLCDMAVKMDVPLFLFIEEKFIPFINKMRFREDGTLKKTHIQAISFSEYRLHPQLERIKQIQTSSEYLAYGVPDCPEVNVPEYPVAVNNKVEFMYQASLINPFNTEYFVWLDAGYGHGKITIPKDYKWDPQTLIDMAGDTIYINTLLDDMRSEDYVEFFKLHIDFIDGGLFIGKKESINKLRKVYYECIRETMDTCNIIDDDQYYMTMVYARNKDLFTLFNIGAWDNRKHMILP